MPFPRSSYANLISPSELKKPDNALYVLIDQSVGFDNNIKTRIIQSINDWLLEPGREIEITRFSSAVIGRYSEVVIKGRFDPEPDEKFLNNLKRSDWIKFSKNYHSNHFLAMQQVNIAIDRIFKDSQPTIAKSDIVSTIFEYSDHIKKGDANKKTLLIISDMFENSKITSFYENGHVRSINPSMELQKVKLMNMLPNFGNNVTVYIVGLGYYWGGDGSKKETYLDPVRINNIKLFWQNYFNDSKVGIGEMGCPIMKGALK